MEESTEYIIEYSISDSIRTCLSRLGRLVIRLGECPTPAALGLAPSLWEDEFGRFKVWSGNIGDNLSGQGSLYFRLREASHIRQNIAELLQDLRQTFQDVEDILEDPESFGSDNAPEFLTGDGEPESDLQQLHRETTTIIGCLFQMSMLLRNPARHSRLTESQPTEISAFEPFDRNHVRDKYPQADDILVQRLGNALKRRRKTLAYWQRHHAKLSRGISGREIEDHIFRNETELPHTIGTDMRFLELSFEERLSR